MVRKRLFIAGIIFVTQLAINARGDDLYEVSGQGIPRNSLEECNQAGKTLAAKLAAMGFRDAKHQRCVNTTEEIGQYRPILSAKNNKRYRIDDSLRSPHTKDPECKLELAILRKSLPPNSILEIECLKGTTLEYSHDPNDPTPKRIEFYQAWTTRLLPIDSPSIPVAPQNVEEEGLVNKAVPSLDSNSSSGALTPKSQRTK